MSLSSLSLPLLLLLLSTPQVQCFGNTVECVLSYGMCSMYKYACGDTSHSRNNYHHSHFLSHSTSGRTKSSYFYHFCPRHWVYACHLGIIFLLQPHFIGLHEHNNLLRFVGQGVHLVVNQLSEIPPIIIPWCTLHQVIGLLDLRHCTTSSIWAIHIGAMIEVIHITLNHWWVLPYIISITESHSWHLVLQSQNIQLPVQFVVLPQQITQCCQIILNMILLQRWGLHCQENGQLCDLMLLLQCLKLCPVLRLQCFVCTIDNAKNLILFQVYFDFQTPALVVHSINLHILNPWRCGHRMISICVGLVVLLRICVNNAGIWNQNAIRVSHISELPGLVIWCTVNTVVNHSIDLNSLTVSLSLIDTYTRTKSQAAPLHTLPNQPTWFPHTHLSPQVQYL